MPNELGYTHGSSGVAIYAILNDYVNRSQALNVSSTPVLEPKTGTQTDYSILLSEAVAGSTRYSGDLPSSTPDGTYLVEYCFSSGGPHAVTDAIQHREVIVVRDGTIYDEHSQGPAPITAEHPHASRTWRIYDTETAGHKSDDILTTHPSADDLTLQFDLTEALNKGTAISAISSVSGSGLTISNSRLSADKKRLLFDITAGLSTATTYTITAVITTTDGQTLAYDGVLEVS